MGTDNPDAGIIDNIGRLSFPLGYQPKFAPAKLLGETLLTDDNLSRNIKSKIRKPSAWRWITIAQLTALAQNVHTRSEIAKVLMEIINNTPLNDTRELLNKISSLIAELEEK